MKNKLLLSISSALIAVLLFMGFTPADKDDDFIILRTIEAHPMMNIAKVMIMSRSDGSIEHFPLESVDRNTKNAVSNLKVETAKIKEILSQGYELKSFSGGGGGDGLVYTYLFIRK